MNDKAVWSQSASYAGMWHSNPPSLLPQREVSKLQKKGREEKGGGGDGACKFLTTNAVTCLQVPTQFPCARLGERHVGGKIRGFPRATCNSP